MNKTYAAFFALLFTVSPLVAVADTYDDAANKAAIIRDCQSLMAAGPNPNFDEFCGRYGPKRLLPGAFAVALPGGTPIRVHLTTKLSSRTAFVGDRFGINVVNEVRVGNRLVIPAGAYGIGEIVSAENAGSNGNEGKLGLQFDYVYALDGQKVRLTQALSAVDGENKKGAASTLTVIMFPLFGASGLFAHNFVKGAEAYIEPETAFPVAVEHTVQVDSFDNDTGFAH